MPSWLIPTRPAGAGEAGKEARVWPLQAEDSSFSCPATTRPDAERLRWTEVDERGLLKWGLRALRYLVSKRTGKDQRGAFSPG